MSATPRHPSLRVGVRRIFRRALAVCGCLICLLGASSPVAAGVYDNQPPVTDRELAAFMELLPHFRAWARSTREDAHPLVNRAGKADFVYSSQAADWVGQRGWKPERFFCVMGRMAAALAIVEEGNDLMVKRPSDMPAVTEAELELVRRNLGSLLRAGSGAPPINQ